MKKWKYYQNIVLRKKKWTDWSTYHTETKNRGLRQQPHIGKDRIWTRLTFVSKKLLMTRILMTNQENWRSWNADKWEEEVAARYIFQKLEEKKW